MHDQSLESPASPDQTTPAEHPKKRGGGPRTPEGRRRSSLNATRHQLTSKVYIATPEESEAYNAHIAAYMEALAPVGLLETELAVLIAGDRWRCKRAMMIENSIFAQGYLDPGKSSTAPAASKRLHKNPNLNQKLPNVQPDAKT